MSRILTPFERHLKEQISDFEMPYDPHSWSSLQKKMGKQKSGKYVWIVALAATVAVSAGGAFTWYRFQHAPAAAHGAFTEARFNSPVKITGISGSSYRSQEGNSEDLTSLTADNNNNIYNNNTNGASHTGNNGGLNQNNALTQNSANDRTGSDTMGNTPAGTPDITLPKGVVVDNKFAFESNVRQACEVQKWNSPPPMLLPTLTTVTSGILEMVISALLLNLSTNSQKQVITTFLFQLPVKMVKSIPRS